ncbi:tripartite motif containing 101 isoform X2 [Antennarius striatus]|uniref:tripartite motif containing 101 isoform X2 n=1 Tax=Antennarius striatus TaxID=241820 RepID=UPI0035AE0D88
MDRKQEEVKMGEATTSLTADLICLQGGGGAEGEAALAMLEKQLICPICLELFSKPVVILPCQHNLCRKCANELYQPSLFQPRTTMLVNSGRFRCPSCRHEVLLDRHGVYGLQRNLLVENIIDVYKQEVNHSNNNASPAPLAPPSAQVTCSDHEGEKVNIYCLTCQVPTCSLCKVFGAHQSCQVAPLTEVCQQRKEELREEVRALMGVNHKIQTIINELEETCSSIEENGRTQKQSVCEEISRVSSLLQERQKALTRRISSEQEEKTGHVRMLLRRYGDSVEAGNKLVERAASSMEEEDMAAFVQGSRELIQQVTAATASCPSETLKPGYESLSRYSCDFSRQERALRGIDFLRAVEDVPEDPEVEQEPEESPESPIENLEPDPHLDTSTQEPEPALEPAKDPDPPVEPVERAAPTSVAVPPDPGPMGESVEPGGAGLEAGVEAEDVKEEESGEKKMIAEEGCEDAREEIVCDQEGMSTQQSERGASAAPRDTEGELSDEEELKEEEEVMLYPSWYKPRTTPVQPELCDPGSPHPAGETPTLSELHKQQQPPANPGHHTQDQPPHNQEPPPLSESQTQPLPQESPSQPPMVPVDLGGGLTPVPQMQETAGEEPKGEGIEGEELEGMKPEGEELKKEEPEQMKPEEEKPEGEELEKEKPEEMRPEGEEPEGEGPEEEDMQGWVCLPGDGFDLVGCGFPSSVPPEETSGTGSRSAPTSEVSDGRLEEEEEEQSDEEALELGSGSEPEERGLGEIEATGGEKEEARMENQDKTISFDSLQALTLFFYLLAFLAILQRFWVYIGCFICT